MNDIVGRPLNADNDDEDEAHEDGYVLAFAFIISPRRIFFELGGTKKGRGIPNVKAWEKISKQMIKSQK